MGRRMVGGSRTDDKVSSGPYEQRCGDVDDLWAPAKHLTTSRRWCQFNGAESVCTSLAVRSTGAVRSVQQCVGTAFQATHSERWRQQQRRGASLLLVGVGDDTRPTARQCVDRPVVCLLLGTMYTRRMRWSASAPAKNDANLRQTRSLSLGMPTQRNGRCEVLRTTSVLNHSLPT